MKHSNDSEPEVIKMTTTKKEANQITEGVIWKQLLFFFFPIVFGTFFQQLYNTVDTLIVGHFVGTDALASVGGSAAQITSLVVGFFTGVSSGATVIISQFFGAKNEHSIQENLHTAYAFSLLGSLIIGAAGVLLSPYILKFMNTSAELMADSTTYLRIYFAGIVFVFIFNVGSGILRAAGDSKRPLYYLIVCCVVNIVLDILFVAAFHMGVAGVAAATVISQSISAILVTRKLMSSEHVLRLNLREIRISRPMLRDQLKIGLPTGFQTIMFSLSNIIIQAALNQFSTATVAAWSVYGKLDALFWMVSSAFGVAITTFVGQNYGAGKTERIHRSVNVCLGMDFVASAIMVLFMYYTRTFLFSIFTTDTEVIRIGSDMLALIMPCYMFYVFIEVLSGALRGVGDVVIPLVITLGGTCILRIVWVIGCMLFYPTVDAIIFSYPVTWILCAVLFLFYYWRKKRSF